MDPETIERKIQLLVEGNDQRNFFGALVGRLSLSAIQVQNYGGVDEFREFLRAFAAMPGFAKVGSIGVVRDAEGRPAVSAFDSVRSSLQRAGLPVPERPGQRSPGVPAVTVFVLPDNDRPGMLETLLRESFANTPEDRCVDAYVECLREAGIPVDRPDKARVHAWLASRREPHVSAGVAALKGYWDLKHPAFARLRAFLSGL